MQARSDMPKNSATSANAENFIDSGERLDSRRTRARRHPGVDRPESSASATLTLSTRISRLPAWLAGPTMPSFSMRSMIEAARL